MRFVLFYAFPKSGYPSYTFVNIKPGEGKEMKLTMVASTAPLFMGVVSDMSRGI